MNAIETEFLSPQNLCILSLIAAVPMISSDEFWQPKALESGAN